MANKNRVAAPLKFEEIAKLEKKSGANLGVVSGKTHVAVGKKKNKNRLVCFDCGSHDICREKTVKTLIGMLRTLGRIYAR